MRPNHTKTQFEQAIQPTIQNGKPAYLRYAQPGQSAVKRTHKEYLIILMRLVNSLPEEYLAAPLKKELLDALDRMQTYFTHYRRNGHNHLPHQKQEDLRSAVLDTINDHWQNVREIREQVLEIIEDVMPLEYASQERITWILRNLASENLIEMQKFDNENHNMVNYYQLKQEEEEQE